MSTGNFGLAENRRPNCPRLYRYMSTRIMHLGIGAVQLPKGLESERDGFVAHIHTHIYNYGSELRERDYVVVAI